MAIQRKSTLPRPLLIISAGLLAAIAILYGVIWMYTARHQGGSAELGFNPVFDSPSQSLVVNTITPDSPAQRAGLRVQDRITAVNGVRLITMQPFSTVWDRARPGDAVELTVTRAGVPQPLILRGIFRALPPRTTGEGLARASANQITGIYPVLFLTVGLIVLSLRLDDPYAWLLALMFAAFDAAPPFKGAPGVPAGLITFGLAYRTTFVALLGPLFYIFFAVFPARSPIDRRLPWLKWVGLALAACFVPAGWRTGDPLAPAALVHLLGNTAAKDLVYFFIYGFVALGLVALGWNAVRAATPEARKKTRVLLFGTVIGVLPIAAQRAATDFAGIQASYWVQTSLILLLFVFPMSFGYAVVKHRVLEIPALLRRSARYVLVQRGFVVLLLTVAAVAILIFTRIFSRFFQTNSNLGMALSSVFGIVLVWASAPVVRRGTQRIDRAFFRGAYDTRRIMQDLAEKTRTVGNQHELAALLEGHITRALHPKIFACYFEGAAGTLVAQSDAGAAAPQTISAALPVLLELTQRGKAWDVPLDEDASAELGPLRDLAPECLVPILGRDSRLAGLLVLGQRLSEEPYSGEDKHLLDSVASQTGIALENMRLAEQMAERMDAERRAAHEMEIARQVQYRLFPQRMPALATLEYAGGCLQARVVGGDYYDFLDLAPGNVGFVLADISGKGIAGALLMANLQANLRSQYALALDQLPRLLHSVNHLFYENTPEDRYATLFFGHYDDATRRLRYVNCGHNPPLLMRAAGPCEHLQATATVLGLFPEWECTVEEVILQPGDTLVLYTDGVTEAPDSTGEEFGDARLVEAVRHQQGRPATELLAHIQNQVQHFSGETQADDITLVVARAI